MAKANKEIIIGQGKLAWQNGIAASPFQGFGDMRNVDVTSWPGALMINLASAKKSGTTITGTPMWFVQNKDSLATVYVLDNANKVYKSDSSSGYATWALVTHASPSTGHGNGMAIWHDYLFIAGDAAVDVMKISNGVWTDAWGGVTLHSDTLTHPMLTGTNDVLYIADGPDTTNILGPTLISVAQKTSQVFDPTSAATYTVIANAVGANLLYGYRIRCLEQMGSNIYIGTFFGNSVSDAQKKADIFPWDRTSSSFGVSIRLKENGVNQLLTVNNTLYIQAGNAGNFYVSNGSLTQSLFSFPRTTTAGSVYRQTTTYPGAIVYNKGKIFFGLTLAGSTSSSGVYSVKPDGSGLIMENSISTGVTDGNVVIGCLLPVNSSTNVNFDYLIGWFDSTSSAQGVDLVGEDNFVTSYGAYVDTDVKVIGTVLAANSLQQIEIYLDRPLASNEGVVISYRTSLSASFTTFVTFDNATFPAAQKYNSSIGPYLSGEMAQFRVALTGVSTSPRLRYLRII